MRLKASGIISRTLYALLALCFLWVFYAVFSRNFYGMRLGLLAVSAAAALIVTALAWAFFSRHEAFLIKYRLPISLAFLILMGAAQAIMIFSLRYEPIFDIGALFNGAAEWANTGDFQTYHEYFAMFRNNRGGLILLRAVFGAAKLFGIKDFFAAASVFNSALSLLTMYLTGSVCAKLAGERGRACAYFMFLISLPFCFIAPAFYTDALSMVFPVLTLRLYIAARGQHKPAGRLALFALTGLAAGAGYGVKATVLIMLIAVILDAILLWDIKNALALTLVSALMVSLCSLAARGIFCSHIDREEAESKSIPVLHWVMMGTYGLGTYDPDEYEFTVSIADPEERAAAVAQRLAERLGSYSAKQFFDLFTLKLAIDYGDGTYGLSDCLACPHGGDNALHGFLLNEGEHNAAYRLVTTGVLLALYALVIASCVSDVPGKSPTAAALAPRLALFGLFLFLLFWEARWRYFSNFVPVIIVSAVMGLESVSGRVRKVVR